MLKTQNVEYKDHILIAEDDVDLASMMATFLKDEGYAAEWIGDGNEALAKLIDGARPSLMILDVMLPGINGVELCQKAKDYTNCPILMLTARDDDLTQINSLNRGADTYLNKPISPHVLLAHIKSLLRRSIDDQSSGSLQNQLLEIQDIKMELNSLKVMIDEKNIELSTAEFQLLEYFLSNPGRMINREELYQSLRGIEYDGIDRTIDMRVSVLRKKMNDAVPPFRYIKTIRSRGYMLAMK